MHVHCQIFRYSSASSTPLSRHHALRFCLLFSFSLCLHPKMRLRFGFLYSLIPLKAGTAHHACFWFARLCFGSIQFHWVGSSCIVVRAGCIVVPSWIAGSSVAEVWLCGSTVAFDFCIRIYLVICIVSLLFFCLVFVLDGWEQVAKPRRVSSGSIRR